MRIALALKLLSEKPAHVATVSWKRELSSLMNPDALRDGYIVVKETTSRCKFGIKGRTKTDENGKKYTDVTPLKWGEYVKNSKTLIKHKGQYYLKLFTTSKTPKVQYYVNGKPASIDYIKERRLMNPGYWGAVDNYQNNPDYICVNINDVQTII